MQFSFPTVIQDILPSSIERTSMYPTALMHDATLAPAIHPLPIATCASSQSTNDWHVQNDAYAVRRFFAEVKGNLFLSRRRSGENNERMAVMYCRFTSEHGCALSMPLQFSLKRHADDIAAIAAAHRKQCGAGALLTTPQVTMMQKFFDSIRCRVKHILVLANRNAEARLKEVMAPLKAQFCEHKDQSQQRRHPIARIHLATDNLGVRIGALERMQSALDIYRQALAASVLVLIIMAS